MKRGFHYGESHFDVFEAKMTSIQGPDNRDGYRIVDDGI